MEQLNRWTPELRFNGLNPPSMHSKDEYYWWVCDGGNWYVAPKNVTLDMVRSQWTRWQPKNYKPNTGIVTYKVKSSSGKGFYTVSIDNGIKSCDCTGFSYRRKCKHTDNISK